MRGFVGLIRIIPGRPRYYPHDLVHGRSTKSGWQSEPRSKASVFEWITMRSLFNLFRKGSSDGYPVSVDLYLNLLKKVLTRTLFLDRSLNSDLITTEEASEELRKEGRDWPTEAETMIGLKRLSNIQECAVVVLGDKVPGDFVETGVWRGGASIFMRAILKAHDVQDRRVWVADSFEGLPKPDSLRYPKDLGDRHHTLSPYLAISLEQVRQNFERYGLLDSQVVFLKGWFKDTLPNASIVSIALLRLDGDMYESTMDSLSSLYHRVSRGGFVIIDDYGCLPNCKAAVDDFRNAEKITDPLITIDWTGVYWQKTAG